MGGTFEEILFDIKEEYGARIFDEPTKLKALMADLAGKFKRERVMLHTAIVNTDIVNVIRECDEEMVPVASARLLAVIMDECGYDETSAIEIVNVLFLVLKKRALFDAVERVSTDVFSVSEPRVPKRGNSVGNIANSGCVAMYDDYIFYRNRSSGGSLYRMYSDGSGKVRISDNKCSNINVLDGYVYYSNWSDGNKLYKVSISGGPQTILNDDHSMDINVIDDWVYYANLSDDGRMYKIRTNGLSKTRICEDVCSFAAVEGDWVYYINERDGDRIYRIKTDGTEREKLCDDECGFLNIEDGWIYYINLSDNGAIYAMPVTNGEKVMICADCCSNINVSDGWIYFTTSGEKLHRMRTDGTGGIRLNNDKSRYINVVRDWIYYVNPDLADKFYRIRLGGSEKQAVY